MNIIRAIFKKRPKEFSKKIEVFYDETLTFYAQGTLKSGDQIFNDNFVKQTPVQEWVYHVFNFEINDGKYEFKVRDDKKKLNFNKDTPYQANVKIGDVKACWFADKERCVYLWEPDDDEDWE